MRRLLQLICGAILLGAFFVTLAPAGDLRPDGYWVTEGQKARYRVATCGRQQLCATLLWIRPDLRTARNVRYINRSIFQYLPRQDESRWGGEVTLEGRTFQGVVELVDYDEMRVTGCVFIICDTVTMSRLPGNS
jgi:uncharacterized protein (DUF2147 family)